jgi:polyisoprenyl-teichoic acid--peptidoglycan teichoic acid transferase
MPSVKVNFAPKQSKKEQKDMSRTNRKHSKNWKNKIAAVLIAIVIVLAVFSSSIVFSDETLTKNASELNFFEKIGRLITGQNKTLDGENDDRINVLILGIGGTSHESGNLADTIMIASYKPSSQQVAMISIPRDLSVNTEKYGQIKINGTHAYAEAREKGSGGTEMINVLEKLLDTKINYYITVDFNGFERIIDEFGGVDVDVERDLTDYQYPIRGKEDIYPIKNRYEVLSIKAGVQHMDGTTALKYARSRHAAGIEGSDFARSKRQQNILVALKEKVFSVSTLFNPKRINSLLSAYKNHIRTNVRLWEISRLAQIGKDINLNNIDSHNLSNGPDGLLYADMVNGAYVLLPNDGDFTEIKNLWKYIFYKDSPSIDSDKDTKSKVGSADQNTEPDNTLANLPLVVSHTTENATIEIQNGTWIAGHAGREKTKLENRDFTVIKAINALNHDYPVTMIYDLSKGENPATATELEKVYQTTISAEIPVIIDSTADFVVVLGTK